MNWMHALQRIAKGAKAVPAADAAARRARLTAKRQAMFQALSGDPWRILGDGMLVGHIMTKSARRVTPDAPMKEVAAAMAASGSRRVLVADASGQLRGIISKSDFLQRSGKTAEDVMTAAVLHVQPQTPLTNAASLMLDHNVNCLPVTEGGVLKGLVTSSDLIISLQVALQIVSRFVRALDKSMASPDEPVQGAISLLAAGPSTESPAALAVEP
jgi:CBS domain-containing protein